MKSYKELLNELANKGNSPLRTLTNEESANLKKEILKIYLDVADICKQHNLTIMLFGGSCLGAVRHKGYIPWDDDLDVVMCRSDYEKFKQLCAENALGDKYEYCYPSKEKDSPVMFMKIYLKDSINLEMGAESTPFPKGIFLDIFIIDGAPENKWLCKLKGYAANTLRLIANMVASAVYPSEIGKKFVSQDKNLNRQYKIRFYLGKLFSVVSHKYWVYWYDKFVFCDKHYGRISIPTGRKLYNGETSYYDYFYPAREAEFEGHKVYIPNQYHLYLTNTYGNYMEIPPIEKRERHFIIDFKLPKNNV